jgi:hypothetical protein
MAAQGNALGELKRIVCHGGQLLGSPKELRKGFNASMEISKV